MTRFMLLQNYGATLACDLPMTEWDPADIKAHIEFQQRLNQELAGAASWSTPQGLAGPEQAKFVRAGKAARPVITDGPFPESKEFLAGYWIVDVETPERAHRDRRAGVGRTGAGRRADRQPIEVRAGDERARPPRM